MNVIFESDTIFLNENLKNYFTAKKVNNCTEQKDEISTPKQ